MPAVKLVKAEPSDPVIETGIPIPSVSHVTKYSFDKLVNVGQSMKWPISYRARIITAASVWKKKNPGWNYTIRNMGDHIRIWRK